VTKAKGLSKFTLGALPGTRPGKGKLQVGRGGRGKKKARKEGVSAHVTHGFKGDVTLSTDFS